MQWFSRLLLQVLVIKLSFCKNHKVKKTLKYTRNIFNEIITQEIMDHKITARFNGIFQVSKFSSRKEIYCSLIFMTLSFFGFWELNLIVVYFNSRLLTHRLDIQSLLKTNSVEWWKMISKISLKSNYGLEQSWIGWISWCAQINEVLFRPWIVSFFILSLLELKLQEI